MNISGVKSSALVILRPSDEGAKSVSLSAIASRSRLRTKETDETEAAAEKPLELTGLKVALYEKTGRALGVKVEDYKSSDDFAAALREALGKLRATHQDHWLEIKAALEHELGLDKLGVSLETVVDSANHDDASEKRLDEALERQNSRSRHSVTL